MPQFFSAVFDTANKCCPVPVECRLILVPETFSRVDGLRVARVPGQDVDVAGNHDGTDQVVRGHLEIKTGQKNASQLDL